MVRLGIAGFGRVAQGYYANALHVLPNADVVFVADPDERALRAAERVFPGATHLPAVDWLQDSTADALLIMAPPAAHSSLALAALVAGKAVYVEKPLALTLADADAMVRACAQSGGIGMTAYVSRFAPPYVRLKARLQAGEAGTVVHARTQLTFDERRMPSWKEVVKTGGGALRDIAVHHADLLAHLLESEVVAVRAQSMTRRREEDTVQVAFLFDNGVRADCLFSSAGTPVDRVEIVGNRRTLRAQRNEVHALSDFVGRVAQRLARTRCSPRPDAAFVGSLTAFLLAVERQSSPEADLWAGRTGVAIVVAAEESQRSGGWVPPNGPAEHLRSESGGSNGQSWRGGGTAGRAHKQS